MREGKYDGTTLRWCPKCRGMATTVTLGGFLTIARCDRCQWYRLTDHSRRAMRHREGHAA